MQMDSKCNADVMQMQCKIPTKDKSINNIYKEKDVSKDTSKKKGEDLSEFYEKVKQKWNEIGKSFGKNHCCFR